MNSFAPDLPCPATQQTSFSTSLKICEGRGIQTPAGGGGGAHPSHSQVTQVREADEQL